MPRIVFFDENATPQAVTGMTGPSVDGSPYLSRTDVVIHPDLSLLATIDPNTQEISSFLVPERYWKHDAGAIVEMTQAEKDAVDAAILSDADVSVRSSAEQGMTGFNGNALLLRAFADIIKDEINILRAEHALAPRTLAQLRTAINNRINDGTVDS